MGTEFLCDGDLRRSWLTGLRGGEELISGTSSAGDVSLHGGVILAGGELVPLNVTSPVERIIATGRAIGGNGGGGNIVDGKYCVFGLLDIFVCICKSLMFFVYTGQKI